LDQINIIAVSQPYVDTYVEIDSYSQKVNSDFKSYPFARPRNMGKNDLWIASLAALLGLELVTTDADFDHLHNVFFPVRKTNPLEFKRFF
jgi:tRNA(fMet)-specific endonuclease VapC